MKGAPPEWVTLAEAAFLTGESPETIHRRADAGEIHSRAAIRGGPLLLLRTADLALAGTSPARIPEAPNESWLVIVRRDSRGLDLLPHLRPETAPD